MNEPLLQFTNKGIYCAQAGVYLDPWKPVTKALITHGHADHARWGHKNYITHYDNLPILKHRLGDINVSGVAHGESVLINNVKFSFHPAGHIPGSCQIRVEHKDEVWVFTGDYKTEDDGISAPYEAVKCDTFITECTFGLPAFKWQPQQQVMNDINAWCTQNHMDGNTSVLFAYSLGKAQRLIKHLDHTPLKIYCHAAVYKMTEVLRGLIDFPPTYLITKETTKEELAGNIVVAPPSAHGTPWLRKMVPYVTASASGWMAFRGARRRRAVDKGFVLSDHCDWDGLLASIDATGCENVITTHGYQDIFARYLREEKGLNASSEHTQYEGDTGAIEENEATDTPSPTKKEKPKKGGIHSALKPKQNNTKDGIHSALSPEQNNPKGGIHAAQPDSPTATQTESL